MIRLLILALLAASWPRPSDANDAPWSQTGIALAPPKKSQPAPSPAPGTLKMPLVWGAWAWQRTVSHADGPSCGYLPTCSEYGKQAVAIHGAPIGFMMAAERVLRNHKLRYGERVIRVNGAPRIADPVSDNDFWWTERE